MPPLRIGRFSLEVFRPEGKRSVVRERRRYGSICFGSLSVVTCFPSARGGLRVVRGAVLTKRCGPRREVDSG